jgi:hypothetical protein
LFVTFSSVHGAEEVSTNERELIIDPRCYDWCLGFTRGYCQKIYPRCAPLRRHLAADELVVAPAEVAEEASSALEVDAKDRELIIDPRCYDWCLGFTRGYCQKIYPRCAPLRRHLAADELVVAPSEVAEEEPSELEADTKDRELIIDPRCYDWCLGFQRGYCQKFYPRCAPL